MVDIVLRDIILRDSTLRDTIPKDIILTDTILKDINLVFLRSSLAVTDRVQSIIILFTIQQDKH